MDHVLKVESALGRIRDGDNGALSEYSDLQVRLVLPLLSSIGSCMPSRGQTAIESTATLLDVSVLSKEHGRAFLQVNQLNQLIKLTRADLARDDRQRIMNLITMDAHARDVVLMLTKDAITDKARS